MFISALEHDFMKEGRMTDMNDRYGSLDQNNKLIWNLRDIGHTMRQISEGKGSQKRILILLKETGGMTQKELTERLGVQPGSVSEVIGKLEASGLVTRSQSEKDRRTMDICLTEEGAVWAKDAYVRRENRHREMFSVLSAEEKDTLLQLLEKVNTDWEQRYRKHEGE